MREAEHARAVRLALAYQKEIYEVEQILGKALGYSLYSDDQKNFPNTTEEDGVCVGGHTIVTLAMEVAERIGEASDNSTDH